MSLEELLKSADGPEAVARNLRAVRAYADISQEELAERSGVNQATISLIERGHRPARKSTIRKLAAALGVEPKILSG